MSHLLVGKRCCFTDLGGEDGAKEWMEREQHGEESDHPGLPRGRLSDAWGVKVCIMVCIESGLGRKLLLWLWMEWAGAWLS